MGGKSTAFPETQSIGVNVCSRMDNNFLKLLEGRQQPCIVVILYAQHFEHLSKRFKLVFGVLVLYFFGYSSLEFSI